MKLGLRLVTDTIAIARLYWPSKDVRKSYWLVALLILLLLADTQLNVWFNAQSGEFTSALAARESDRFWQSIRTYLLLLLIAVPEYSAYYYARDRLSLYWRRALTHRTVSRYSQNQAYYHIRVEGEIDNPDQRIADDIYSITHQSVNFLLIVVGAVFQVLAFGRVLWQMSGHLILFLVAYATVTTAVTYGVFGNRIASLYNLQRRKEADFRFGLVRVRENAEFIALYRGEKPEFKRLHRLFGFIYDNYLRLIRWQFGLNFFQYTHTLLVALLPSVIIAPRVLSGQLEVGKIVEATGAFTAIMGSLTILVDNMEDLASFAAGINRVRTLNRRLKKHGPKKRGETISFVEGSTFRFDGVTLHTPNYERTLIRKLEASVAPGANLMIVGDSGLGKSSLLRMMAGLWNCGSGTLEHPSAADLLFLPQHAYMMVGTLREQLEYPALHPDLKDHELAAVLARVRLAGLAERCGGFDHELDFEKVLSVGERQRLAFARVLLRNPRYVLLDEATSALDRDNEEALYKELLSTNTTIISVSHHRSLLQYHSQILELKPGGEWSLHPASASHVFDDLV